MYRIATWYNYKLRRFGEFMHFCVFFSGDYVNLDSDETHSMSSAIQKGWVKTKSPPSPATSAVSFSIQSVTDPRTGKLAKPGDE